MAVLISSGLTFWVRLALLMMKLAALMTLNRCSQSVTIQVLLSATVYWSNSRNDCLLLAGCVEMSSPARKLVPMKLLLACEVAMIEYRACKEAFSSSLLLK
ncbi:hypothetical protein EVA_15794 [gut metagenome]|uniref:Uncharacterized protein n=1 Tax=gut metagenome TaxID=749906 RepID=J9G9J3_9ZZZZ